MSNASLLLATMAFLPIPALAAEVAKEGTDSLTIHFVQTSAFGPLKMDDLNASS
jgi:hypothetical protein